MLVKFKRFFCTHCEKQRWHETVHAPCCVTCHNYKWGAEDFTNAIEIERWSDN